MPIGITHARPELVRGAVTRWSLPPLTTWTPMRSLPCPMMPPPRPPHRRLIRYRLTIVRLAIVRLRLHPARMRLLTRHRQHRLRRWPHQPPPRRCQRPRHLAIRRHRHQHQRRPGRRPNDRQMSPIPPTPSLPATLRPKNRLPRRRRMPSAPHRMPTRRHPPPRTTRRRTRIGRTARWRRSANRSNAVTTSRRSGSSAVPRPAEIHPARLARAAPIGFAANATWFCRSTVARRADRAA